MEGFLQAIGQYGPGSVALAVVLWDYYGGKKRQQELEQSQWKMFDKREKEQHEQMATIGEFVKDQAKSLQIIAEATSRLDQVLQKHSEVAADIHEYVLGTVAMVKNIDNNSVYIRDAVNQMVKNR